jgi:hypothetical protein
MIFDGYIKKILFLKSFIVHPFYKKGVQYIPNKSN